MRLALPKCLALPLCLALSACNTAGPGFYGQTAHEVTSGKHRFVIRVNGPMAEVTRTNAHWLPKYDEVSKHGAQAVETLTGCSVGWIDGDTALMKMGLACNGQKAPPKPRKTQRSEFFCDASERRGTGRRVEVWVSCEAY